MSTKLVIKVEYNGTLRRFITYINKDGELDLKFCTLKGKIRNIFGLPFDAIRSLTYVDEDGDIVTLASDEDLLDIAAQNLKFLKINVSIKGTNESKPSLIPQSPLPSTLHCEMQEALGDILSRIKKEDPSKASSTTKVRSRSSKYNLIKPKELEVKPLTALQIGTNSIFNFSNPPSETFTGSHLDGDSFLSNPRGRACHDGVECDECGANPIIGARYKPLDAKQYDLCETCYAKMGYPPNYERIATPIVFPNNSIPSKPIWGAGHVGEAYDDCGANPIDGARYKSPLPQDYDLCEACFDKMGKPAGYQTMETAAFNLHGPFGGYSFDGCLALVSCKGCNARSIDGARYKSKVKFDYDLCEGCFFRVCNPADYERIETPDFFSPFYHKDLPYQLPSYFHRNGSKLESHFEEDVTVPDNTVISPGASFRKVWRLRNSGNSRWPRGTRLAWIGGDELSDVNSVELDISDWGLPQGNKIDVSVDLTAPLLPGTYVSHWTLMYPVGISFGQRVWVIIQVDDSASGAKNMNFDLNVAPDLNPVNQTGSNLVGCPRLGSNLVGCPKLGSNLVECPKLGSNLVECPKLGSNLVECPKLVDGPVRRNEGMDPGSNELGNLNMDAYESALGSLLKELDEMGFSDKEQNLRLLKKHSGSITRVVMDWLSK